MLHWKKEWKKNDQIYNSRASAYISWLAATSCFRLKNYKELIYLICLFLLLLLVLKTVFEMSMLCMWLARMHMFMLCISFHRLVKFKCKCVMRMPKRVRIICRVDRQPTLPHIHSQFRHKNLVRRGFFFLSLSFSLSFCVALNQQPRAYRFVFNVMMNTDILLNKLTSIFIVQVLNYFWMR